MKISIICILIFITTNTFSQKTELWNKEQKNTLYQKCMQKVKLNQISEKNKQDYCYCNLQKITRDFSPIELANLITPEQKRIDQKYYNECSTETGIVFSQNTTSPNTNSTTEAGWSKQKRAEHYEKCKKNVFARNGNITIPQQEEFCLCYLDKLTAKYNISELDNMIAPEFKRTQNTYFDICAIETDISLQNSNSNSSSTISNQSNWDKFQKTTYYNDCEEDLSNSENGYTANEVENLCMCFIEKVTKEYTVAQLDEMITPELKRVKKQLYDRCNVNSNSTSISHNDQIIKKSKARGGTYYYRNPPIINKNGYEVALDNIVAKKDYCKMAIKITNNSSDYLLVKNNEITYQVDENLVSARKNKEFVLAPQKKKSYVLDFKENYYLHEQFSLLVNGLYSIKKQGNSVKAPKFDLPISQNQITFDDFTVTLQNLVKETKETVATFEVTYHGNSIGLLKPNELGVRYTNKGTTLYANDQKGAGFAILEQGERCIIKAVFHISAKVGDMQFESMEIDWQNTFQISQKKKINVEKINVFFEKSK